MHLYKYAAAILLVCGSTPTHAAVAPLDAPSAEEQAAIIERMRSYAAGYLASLPDFLCTEQTAHLESGSRRGRWHKGDVVEAQLSSVNGKEHQTVQTINGKPVTYRVQPWRWRLTTEGEFGADLTQVFEPASETQFEWNRWTAFAGKKLAVFRFNVDQQHSTKKLSRMGVSAIIGYHGEVWGDPETGQVWHVWHDSFDIPPELDTVEIQTEIDYGLVEIAGANYLLPTRAAITQQTSSRLERNELTFRDYRKFQADSTVTFDEPK